MIGSRDLLVIVLIACAASVAVSLLGALLLRALRTRSTSTQLIVVVSTALGSVLAAATGTAAAMFLSGHDLEVLLVVAAVAGLLGLVTALLLGRAVMAASAAVEAAAAQLGDAPYVPVPGPLPAELAALDRQLARTSDRLDAARERERAADASRRELVTWLSHDLRTPLTGVRALAEALVDWVARDPATVAQYARDIQARTERLTAMVDELFDLSRISSGTLRLELEDLSLVDLVSDAVAGLRPSAQAQGVHVWWVGDGDPVVRASASQLGRAVTNLLANAVRNTPVGGIVRVETREHGGAAELLVQDACGGIPAVELAQLFDVGYSRPTSHGGAGGGGLGLAIARGVVEAHNGDVTISNHGAGCLAVVRVPLAAAGPSGSPQGAAASSASSRSPRV